MVVVLVVVVICALLLVGLVVVVFLEVVVVLAGLHGCAGFLRWFSAMAAGLPPGLVAAPVSTAAPVFCNVHGAVSIEDTGPRAIIHCLAYALVEFPLHELRQIEIARQCANHPECAWLERCNNPSTVGRQAPRPEERQWIGSQGQSAATSGLVSIRTTSCMPSQVRPRRMRL